MCWTTYLGHSLKSVASVALSVRVVVPSPTAWYTRMYAFIAIGASTFCGRALRIETQGPVSDFDAVEVVVVQQNSCQNFDLMIIVVFPSPAPCSNAGRASNGRSMMEKLIVDAQNSGEEGLSLDSLSLFVHQIHQRPNRSIKLIHAHLDHP